MRGLKQFSVFLDIYYWKTAILIARSAMSKQYRNSFLGAMWTLIQPLIMLLVFTLVMPILIKFPVKDYALYILCTMPLWNFFSSTLIGAALSLLEQAETLKRCMISSTVFPIADVLKQGYSYCIAFLTMYIAGMLLGLPGSWHVILLPLYLIPIMLTIMAASVGIAFVAPYVRDVADMLLIGMSVLSWFSAVPYPAELLPEHLRVWLEWNPFYILLKPVIILVYEHQIPDLVTMARLFGLMALTVLVSYSLYRACRRNFVYYL